MMIACLLLLGIAIGLFLCWLAVVTSTTYH
jgi:hypothetical protein